MKQPINLSKIRLSAQEKDVLFDKGTERPGTGALLSNEKEGLYLCKNCLTPLYTSDHKFESHCGWPSFDDEIEGAVLRQPDADGRRTEIICNNCYSHLEIGRASCRERVSVSVSSTLDTEKKSKRQTRRSLRT